MIDKSWYELVEAHERCRNTGEPSDNREASRIGVFVRQVIVQDIITIMESAVTGGTAIETPYSQGRESGLGRATSQLWFRSCPERHSPRLPEPQPSSSAVVQVHPTADSARLRAPLVAGSGWRRQS